MNEECKNRGRCLSNCTPGWWCYEKRRADAERGAQAARDAGNKPELAAALAADPLAALPVCEVRP